MGKDPFEDPEVEAMRASMRPPAGPMRWGRVLTGVLVVACATFALAYYLPLQRAHTALTTHFAELRSKVDSANRAVEESRRSAKELSDKNQALQSRKPGDAVPVVFRRRDGVVNATLRFVEDPRVQAIPIENTGRPLDARQRAFRDAWLTSRADAF